MLIIVAAKFVSCHTHVGLEAASYMRVLNTSLYFLGCSCPIEGLRVGTTGAHDECWGVGRPWQLRKCSYTNLPTLSAVCSLTSGATNLFKHSFHDQPELTPLPWLLSTHPQWTPCSFVVVDSLLFPETFFRWLLRVILYLPLN